MAATTRKSTRASSASSTNNANKMLLYYTVIIASITSQFLSVNALRCHQCNSHLDEDCTTLRLSTPRAPLDDQFLKECEETHAQIGHPVFCRKTVLTIEVTGEHRIIRGCGWLRDRAEVGNNSCFTADNEGYKQIICACNKDGCNGSSALYVSKWSVLTVTAVSVFLATVLRRN